MSVGIIPRAQRVNTGLSPLHPGCEELFFRWFNDPRIYLHMGDLTPYPFTLDDARKYSEAHKKDTWIIIAKDGENWVPIGYSGLYIRNRHRVGIIRHAIGEREYLGKGHAKMARIMSLAWAFNECDLVTVVSSISSSNNENLQLCLKVGFRECGRYLQYRNEDGKRYDEIHLEFLRDDFYNKYPEYTRP